MPCSVIKGLCLPYNSFVLMSLASVLFKRAKHGLTLGFLFDKNKCDVTDMREMGRGFPERSSLRDNMQSRFCTHRAFHVQDHEKILNMTVSNGKLHVFFCSNHVDVGGHSSVKNIACVGSRLTRSRPQLTRSRNNLCLWQSLHASNPSSSP